MDDVLKIPCQVRTQAVLLSNGATCSVGLWQCSRACPEARVSVAVALFTAVVEAAGKATSSAATFAVAASASSCLPPSELPPTFFSFSFSRAQSGFF